MDTLNDQPSPFIHGALVELEHYPGYDIDEIQTIHLEMSRNLNDYLDVSVGTLETSSDSHETFILPVSLGEYHQDEDDTEEQANTSLDLEKENNEIKEIFECIRANTADISIPSEKSKAEKAENERIEEAKDYQKVLHAQLRYRLDKSETKKSSLMSNIRTCRNELLEMFESRDVLVRDVSVWLPREWDKEEELFDGLMKQILSLKNSYRECNVRWNEKNHELKARIAELLNQLETARERYQTIHEEWTREHCEFNIKCDIIRKLEHENEHLLARLYEIRHEQRLKQENAVVLIQSWFKGLKQRHIFKIILKVTLSLQRSYRSRVDRRRRAAILIQAQWKGLILVKSLKLTLGYKIQKIFKEMKIMTTSKEDAYDFDIDQTDDELDTVLDGFLDLVNETKVEIATIQDIKPISKMNVVETHRESVKKVTDEWGFSNSITAELALRKQKKLQMLHNRDKNRKKFQDPFERLKLFHRNQNVSLPPLPQQQTALPGHVMMWKKPPKAAISLPRLT